MTHEGDTYRGPRGKRQTANVRSEDETNSSSLFLFFVSDDDDEDDDGDDEDDDDVDERVDGGEVDNAIVGSTCSEMVWSQLQSFVTWTRSPDQLRHPCVVIGKLRL